MTDRSDPQPKASQVEVEKISLEQCRERQAAGEPFVVSYGMGVDSTAMLIGLYLEGLRPDAVIFADTGAEKSETYRYLDVVDAWLRSVGFPTVTVVRYEPSSKRAIDPRTGREYVDFEGKLLATGQLPSLAYKAHQCSITWKQVAQHRYLAGWAPRAHDSTATRFTGWTLALEAWARGLNVIKAIGYDCGTADLKRGSFAQKHEPKLYDYAYPLRWWGWTRDNCIAVIADAGLPVPPKSSCYFCPAMKADEVRDLAMSEPDLLLRALALEDQAFAAGRAAYDEAERTGVDRNGKAFDPIKTERVRLNGLWTLNRPNRNTPTSWRAFCEAEGLLELALAAAGEEQAA